MRNLRNDDGNGNGNDNGKKAIYISKGRPSHKGFRLAKQQILVKIPIVILTKIVAKIPIVILNRILATFP